jgi:type 1 glutamine amidotransferase/HEAT repeat protein
MKKLLLILSALLTCTPLFASDETQAIERARQITALTAQAEDPSVKPRLLVALSDESELVRLVALRATVKTCDPAAFPLLFAACSKDGEEGRLAPLMVASSPAKGLDAFLYEQMAQPAKRCKAIELLASRHEKGLIAKLCDPSLYAEKGVNQAAAGAFRLCLQGEDFAKAMTFVFTSLPAGQCEPFVSALSSVAQQLPGKEQVEKGVLAQFLKLSPEARLGALELLGSLQSPSICQVLADEAKQGTVDYRKAIVRTLSKWSQPIALDALVTVAKGDADGSVKILAIRSVITLLEKKDMADATKKAEVLKTLATVAERDEEKQLIEAALKSVGGAESKKLPNAPMAAVPTTGKIRVLLLSGANNHNWQETTESLKKVLAKNPKFAVTVTETPWEMTPDALASCDVVFFNWNTFGKDKREWSQPMKDAFIPWVKKGGGVFIFHAGGSIFYNWPEFMSLIGGTWEKGTYHPKQQEYTVKIENVDHPITKGMKDFVTFDEPWQKLSNRNPDRKMLATTTIPKEKSEKAGGGTGESEVMAMTMELEKGRCFNLVLGHNAKSIENEGCTSLILRGTEWAATGEVK